MTEWSPPTESGATRWDVRWKVLGRWQTKTFKRRSDADAFRRTVEADELRGVVVDMRRSSVSFDAFATGWLATRRRPDGRPLAPKTHALYADLLRRLILPTFGAAKLASIQASCRPSGENRVADRPRDRATMAAVTAGASRDPSMEGRRYFGER